jgi:hypothetical protein
VEKGLKLNKLCLIDGLENGKVTWISNLWH